MKKNLEKLVNAKGGKSPAGSVASALDFSETDTASLEEFGYTVSVPKLKDAMGNDDCFSLVEIATYGAKGELLTFQACTYRSISTFQLIHFL